MVVASITASTPGSADEPVFGGSRLPSGALAARDLAEMQNEVVALALDLVDAPERSVGHVAADRDEAALLAVLAARESRPTVQRPTIVVADTVHPAYHRAARLLGVEVLTVHTDTARRAQVGAMTRAMDVRAVLAVVSAPSDEDGVIDPVTWIGTAAAAKGVPLHVDATSGGWLLAFGERLGRVVPPWTFAAPAISTIALDLHEPRAGDGTVLLFRDHLDRRRCELPGTDPARGAILAAWQRVTSVGHDGFLRAASATLRAVDMLVAAVPGIPGLRLLRDPEAAVLALGTDATCDVFTIAEELRSRGWYAEARPSRPGEPPRLRLVVDAVARERAEDCVTELGEVTASARALGPVQLPRRVLDHLALLAHLDPVRLTTTDVRLLLDGLGLDPASAAASGRFEALVDAAPARLRAALAGRHRELLHTPRRP